MKRFVPTDLCHEYKEQQVFVYIYITLLTFFLIFQTIALLAKRNVYFFTASL
jgi:hypothetical protein